MKYYDINTKGFYENQILDSIEMTDEYWQELLNKQSLGGIIQAINGQVFCVLSSEKVENEQIIDIKNTDEYKAKVSMQEKATRKSKLQSEIDELDLKSIRALREGGLKDTASGETWAEYYTSQIQAMRAEMANL